MVQAIPGSLSEGVSFDEWNPPFVGAMKIARQPRILASTRMNGTSPSPTPSLRELSRPTGVTEGVSPDERNRSKITEFICAGV